MYSISFKTRSQSVRGETKDFPAITVLVSHPKFNNRKFRYATGEVIHKKLWNEKKGFINTDIVEAALPREAASFFRPATYRDGAEIRSGYMIEGQVVQGTVLQALKQKLNDLDRKIQIWMDRNALKPKWENKDLKKYLDSDKPIKGVDQVDVFKKWEEIINATLTKEKEPIALATKRAKTATLTRVKEYFGKQSITFESFNQDFYNDFMTWMAAGDREKKREPMLKNTRGKHIKEVKSVLRRVLKTGIAVSPAFLNNEDFRTVKENSDEVYLTENELIKMLKAKLPPHLERVRDTFVAASYVGARYGDWREINSANIIEEDGIDFLRYTTSKTKISCTVQLHAIPRMILDKYHGTLPLITNQKTNKALKTIAKEAKLGTKISAVKTHTARRSFCTNMYIAGVEVTRIMVASGHQSEKIFNSYVRANDLQKAVSGAKNDKSTFFRNGVEAVMELSKSMAS